MSNGQRPPKSLTHDLTGQRFLDGTLGDNFSCLQDEKVREASRDFLDVVSDHDHRWGTRFTGKVVKHLYDVLARTDIQASGWFVEEQ
jgi:hypothetical protein